jgi:hypothetical protein
MPSALENCSVDVAVAAWNISIYHAIVLMGGVVSPAGFRAQSPEGIMRKPVPDVQMVIAFTATPLLLFQHAVAVAKEKWGGRCRTPHD